VDRAKPAGHGMLELYFAPVKNYPLINVINAIEAEPECRSNVGANLSHRCPSGRLLWSNGDSFFATVASFI
jgi:hypothetical protein